MPLDDLRLLLVRPQDLVVALVRLVDLHADGDTLTAGAAARLEFTFPPQATGELLFDAGAADAELGGTSEVAFSVEEGTRATLTVEGVLGLAARGTPLPDGTSVELPWRLAFRPQAKSKGDTLRATVPAAPLLGEGGAAGLWHVRLEAASGLGLLPLEGDAGDVRAAATGVPPLEFVPPLAKRLRDQIRAQGQPPQDPPTLGGAAVRLIETAERAGEARTRWEEQQPHGPHGPGCTCEDSGDDIGEDEAMS